MTSERQLRARDQITAIVAAHTALTGQVVHAARLTAGHGYPALAAHLDRHRAELNVVIGEFAIWAESFGDWAVVGPAHAIYPPAVLEPPPPGDARPRTELRQARDELRSRLKSVLSVLSNAREALRDTDLPVDHLTTYRRLVRLWAGEAVELLTQAHRLALADHYLHQLGRLPATGRGDRQHCGTALLREWMRELDEPDRESELSLAEACGFGYLVERYRPENGMPLT